MNGMSPTEIWRASMNMTFMLLEAQSVIAMRTMGMAGFWNLGPKEHTRMMSEKSSALSDAGMAMATSLWRGQHLGIAMAAAVAPVRERTRANHARLTRRGPFPR